MWYLDREIKSMEAENARYTAQVQDSTVCNTHETSATDRMKTKTYSKCIM